MIPMFSACDQMNPAFSPGDNAYAFRTTKTYMRRNIGSKLPSFFFDLSVSKRQFPVPLFREFACV